MSPVKTALRLGVIRATERIVTQLILLIRAIQVPEHDAEPGRDDFAAFSRRRDAAVVPHDIDP